MALNTKNEDVFSGSFHKCDTMWKLGVFHAYNKAGLFYMEKILAVAVYFSARKSPSFACKWKQGLKLLEHLICVPLTSNLFVIPHVVI